MYTFENRCLQNLGLQLEDEATKIFLNTKGTLDDVDQNMNEFLTYIENSSYDIAKQSKSELIKVLNEKVNQIKNNKILEVEYMTLYERLEECKAEGRIEGKIEGIEIGVQQTKLENAKAFLDIANDETIATKIGLSIEVVKQLREEYLKENQI